MIDRLELVFFTVVLLYGVYDSICVAPEPRVPISAKDASLSFLSGELGPPKSVSPFGGVRVLPVEPPPPKPSAPANTRDYVAPKPDVPPGTQVPSTGNIPKPSAPVPGTPSPKTPPRDFVNPNFKPGQSPNIAPPKPPSAPVNPAGQVTTAKPGGRDFVNPNFKPGQTPATSKPATPGSVSLSQILNPGNVPQNTGGRDFVNPNFPPKSGSQPQTPIVKPGPPSTPKDPFPALPPKPSSPTRDFVNPNFPVRPGSPTPGRPQTPPPSPGTPKDPFPPLRGAPPAVPAGPGVVPSGGGSYAQRVSGGVTTPRTGSVSAGPVPSTDTVSTPEPEPEGPKDNELREFSEALLKKDVNNAFKYVKLNIQGKTTSNSKNDEAPNKLLEVDNAAFNIPTIAKLRLFYNNYILEVTENEHVTPQEKAEENDFIDAVMNTPIMQHTRNFLIANGKLSKDPKEFKDLLRTMWFSLYSRGGGRVGSSGFEHIFLAELKKSKNEVSGLHNWLYFSEAEKMNLVNYLGYMKKIDLGDKGAILKFHFSLDGVDKPVSSIFVGTSPELEMALYTTCYIFRPNRVCPLRLNGNNFIVRAFSMRYRGKHLLGSAFPEI